MTQERMCERCGKEPGIENVHPTEGDPKTLWLCLECLILIVRTKVYTDHPEIVN